MDQTSASFSQQVAGAESVILVAQFSSMRSISGHSSSRRTRHPLERDPSTGKPVTFEVRDGKPIVKEWGFMR